MRRARPPQHGAAGPAVEVRRWPARPGCSWSCGRTSAGVACATGARGRASARQLAAARARGDGAHGLGEQGERERDKAAAAAERRMWLRAGRGGRGRALGPDHEQDAGGAEICCRPDRRPGMTQDLAGAAPARGRSPAVDRVGSSKITFSTPARAVRSPFRLTCLRTAPTGGEEGGEPAGAVCARSPRAGGVRAVAARWWATAHRAERGASEEHTGQCAVRDSQIAKSNKKNRMKLS